MTGFFENVIVDLPIRLKGNSKQTPGDSLCPLGAQNKIPVTYPFPKLTLTPTCHLGQNDGLGEG